MGKWRGYFIQGLIILFPFVLSLLVIYWLVDLFTYPLNAWLSHLVHYKILLRILGFICTIAFIILFGFLVEQWILKRLVKKLQRLFLKTPIVRKIYKSCYKAITALFKKKGRAFSSVVTFEYADTNGKVIGIVPHDDNIFENHLPVIHTGPSPLHNMIFFVDKDQYKTSTIPIEVALRWSISAGSAPLTDKPVVEEIQNNKL